MKKKLVLVSFEVFDAGKFSSQLFGFMNQDREVLRADPVLLILKLDGQQGYFLLAALAKQAVRLRNGHDNLL